MDFWLGTHHPDWLGRAGVPLFVSHRWLTGRKRLPLARERWALDSGGFTELSLYGRWRTTPLAYVSAVYRYQHTIGRLEWASPQDWMCEPWIVAKTGLSVPEHQHRTTVNYLLLRALGPDLPFIPVLQGWQLNDYLAHIESYERAGVDLHAEPVVGVGSVCRRQRTGQIEHILAELAATGLRLHAFGLKLSGLRAGAHHLASADSMAWSYDGRRTATVCGSTTHRHEANCLTFAIQWRAKVLSAVESPKQLAFTGFL